MPLHEAICTGKFHSPYSLERACVPSTFLILTQLESKVTVEIHIRLNDTWTSTSLHINSLWLKWKDLQWVNLFQSDWGCYIL